jgi:hypothetical protein
VDSAEKLVRTATDLLQDSERRAKLAAASKGWHEVNRGATERTLAVIQRRLKDGGGK